MNPNEITLALRGGVRQRAGLRDDQQPHELQEGQAGRHVADVLPRRHRRQRPRRSTCRSRSSSSRRSPATTARSTGPNYLKVGWGTLQIKRCVLKSASIAYKLFKPDGVPAARGDHRQLQRQLGRPDPRGAWQQDQSPDLTHVRLVKAGDTLPTLCHADLRRPALLPAGGAGQRPRRLPQPRRRARGCLPSAGEIAMPDARTLPDSRRSTASSPSRWTAQPVAREHQLLAAACIKTVNRISSARLVYLDGAAAGERFSAQQRRDVRARQGGRDPGRRRRTIRSRCSRGSWSGTPCGSATRRAPQLIVECRHAAIKLTVGRKNAYFFDQTDSDVIAAADPGRRARPQTSRATSRHSPAAGAVPGDGLGLPAGARRGQRQAGVHQRRQGHGQGTRPAAAARA